MTEKCKLCRGPTGWMVIEINDFYHTVENLDVCKECGTYAMCSRCSYGDPDIRYVAYVKYNDEIYLEPDSDQICVDVKLTWCEDYGAD